MPIEQKGNVILEALFSYLSDAQRAEVKRYWKASQDRKKELVRVMSAESLAYINAQRPAEKISGAQATSLPIVDGRREKNIWRGVAMTAGVATLAMAIYASEQTSKANQVVDASNKQESTSAPDIRMSTPTPFDLDLTPKPDPTPVKPLTLINTSTPTPESISQEKEIPPAVKDEAVSLNELLGLSLGDQKKFATNFKRMAELYKRYGKEVLKYMPIFEMVYLSVEGNNKVIFGLNSTSKTDVKKFRLSFEGTDPEKLVEAGSVFNSSTFITKDMGNPRLGFRKNPAEIDFASLYVNSENSPYSYSMLNVDGADSLGVAIYSQMVGIVQRVVKANGLSWSSEQINEAAYQATVYLQASEWRSVDGTQPLIQMAGEGHGSLLPEASITVKRLNGKTLDLLRTKVSTCRVQYDDAKSGDPKDQKVVSPFTVQIRPQDGLTEYKSLDADSKQISFVTVDQKAIENAKWRTPDELAQVILAKSKQLSVYVEKEGMKSIPKAYEVSPEDLMSDQARDLAFAYTLCGKTVPGTKPGVTQKGEKPGTTTTKTGTPVNEKTPPNEPSKTPHRDSSPTPTPHDEKTPTPELTNVATNVPNTAASWTPEAPGAKPTDVTYPTVEPTADKPQPTTQPQPTAVTTDVFGDK